MGLSKFTTLFSPQQKVKKSFANFQNTTIVVDGAGEVHRALKGMVKINHLTSQTGERTQHVNIILMNILERRRNNITEYWVFDNPQLNIHKLEEIASRHAVREKAGEKVNQLIQELQDLAADDEKLQSYEKAASTVTTADYDKIKQLLDYFGIPWMESPPNVEAEKVCAILTRQNIMADYVLTGDTDTIIYGAKKIIMRCSDKANEGFLLIYELAAILEENELDMADLRKIAIFLGTDHNRKGRRGIGPKKVMTFYKNAELTSDEKLIEKIFSDPVENIPEWNQKDPDLSAMVEWLVKDLSFKRERIIKLLEKQPSKTISK